MGTVNVTLGDGKKLNLVLGQQLENAVTAVVFDFSAWKTEFGSGTLGLSVQRHGDDQPYAVVPTVSGTNATWNISELDTAYKGVGEVQVTYTVGSVVKKSTVYKFTVYRSLGENGEYPSPGQTWQEEIEDELSDVRQDLTYSEIGNSFDGLLSNAYWDSSGSLIAYNGDVCNTNKIPCKEGDVVEIITDPVIADVALFVPYFNSAGTTRVRSDTGTGTAYKGVAPANASYVCFTFEKSGLSKNSFNSVFVYVNNAVHRIDAEVKNIHNNVSNILDTDFYSPHIANGSVGNSANTTVVNTSDYIPCGFGDIVTIDVKKAPKVAGGYYTYGYNVYNSSKTEIRAIDYGKGKYRNHKVEIIDTTASYIRFTIAEITADGSAYTSIRMSEFNDSDVNISVAHDDGVNVRLDELDHEVNNRLVKSSEIVQGSYDGNGAVTSSSTVIRVNNPIRVKNGQMLIFVPGSNAEKLLYGIFGTTMSYTSDSAWITEKASINISWDGYIIPIFKRIDGTSLLPSDYDATVIIKSKAVMDDVKETEPKLSNARHMAYGTGTPLTLFHFSDLHGDRSALSRLMEYASSQETDIDDIICTGDMVANTAEQITSWWNPKVMTCIGNHDSASYSSQNGYDWDALSMANRDAYYIAPFESNWGITHTSGKSYYYKDYSTQKIRLIVMDSQAYLASGTDATTQTEWLADLLASAITNSFHVVIAIHAPYNNSAVINCSFSRYGRTNMATLSDSYTPQEVVEVVASAINSGLKFIGYIVGHNHQDYIFSPANGQIGFCVTCAAVSQKAQWIDSDQDRSVTKDAYNLVTIDTTNTLIKIIRGGGANIDDHMRTRKAICFNYSTGEKVGEVL